MDHASFFSEATLFEIGVCACLYFSLKLQVYYRYCFLIERFSYDLEMKAREQNRNDERTEIERFDWFIERKDKRVWLFIG